MRQPAQALSDVASGGGRVGQRFAAFQLRRQVAMAQLQGRRQRAGPRRPDPMQGGQRPGVAVQQPAKAALLGQQAAGARDRVASGGAGAEEDREQLRVRQGAGAACQQLLAGTFGGGPVADVHGRRLTFPRHGGDQAAGEHRVS